MFDQAEFAAVDPLADEAGLVEQIDFLDRVGRGVGGLLDDGDIVAAALQRDGRRKARNARPITRICRAICRI